MRSIFREWNILLLDLFATKDKEVPSVLFLSGTESKFSNQCFPSELGNIPDVCLSLLSLRLFSKWSWTVPNLYLLHQLGQSNVDSLNFSVCLFNLPNLFFSFPTCCLSTMARLFIWHWAICTSWCTWLDEEERHCSEAVQRILLNNRKPSTRSTYLAEWKLFSVWSMSNVDIGLQDIAGLQDYLLHWKSLDLALSSLRVYMASISAFHPVIQGNVIFLNSMVVRFLKGIVHLWRKWSHCGSLPLCWPPSWFLHLSRQ